MDGNGKSNKMKNIEEYYEKKKADLKTKNIQNYYNQKKEEHKLEIIMIKKKK